MGVAVWGWEGGWGCPSHMCTCMHMQAHTHMHIYMLNMIISSANGSPHWGNPLEFPMMSYAHASVCMCMCMGGTSSPPPTPIHHPLPPGGTPGISGGDGVGCMGVGGGWGCPSHMCTCMHMQACTRMHIYMLNMIISSANGSPHWGNPLEFPMMSYAHASVCMCMCMGAPPHHHPPRYTHPPPPGGTPRISHNSIALELIEIFQFCLKI